MTSNPAPTTAIPTVIRVLQTLIITLIALAIYVFQLSVYLFGNAWKDNSTDEMVALNIVNLIFVVVAIVAAAKNKMAVAGIALVIELIGVYLLISLF